MKLISFKYFLVISRPIIFPLLLLCLLVALFFSSPNKANITFIHLFFIFLLTFLFPFFTFSVNDLEDIDSDKVNKRKKNILFGKYISNLKDFSKSIYLYCLIIFLILFLYTLYFFSLETTLILVLLSFFVFFYSKKPLRFKEMFFIDSLSNGLIALLCFSLVYTLFNDFSTLPVAIYLVSLSISSYHLIAAQMDVDSDKKSSHKTTATILKNRHLVYLLCLLYNLPLLFFSFSSLFKYLFFLNILIIFLVYFFENINKIYLFIFFIFSWLVITINYFWSYLF